jgi:hypothetical protein
MRDAGPIGSGDCAAARRELDELAFILEAEGVTETQRSRSASSAALRETDLLLNPG